MENKLNLEDSLSRLLFGLWPKTTYKKVHADDEVFQLLKAEAEKAGMDSVIVPEFYHLAFSYALAGFEAKDGGWKAVFKPYLAACTLYYSTRDVAGFDIISEEALAEVIRALGVPGEVDIDIPRVEEVPLAVIGDRGTVVEGDEKYWRLADKKYGG